MKRLVIALISGFIFGIGLAVSQMINPVKVTDFLDITGHWDPSLILVMAGALFVTMISFRFIMKRSGPRYANRFSLPTKTVVDWKLVTGAALFGLG